MKISLSCSRCGLQPEKKSGSERLLRNLCPAGLDGSVCRFSGSQRPPAAPLLRRSISPRTFYGGVCVHVILSIALAMELTLPETDRLLRIARMPLLEARNRRDPIPMFALSRRLTVPDTNDIPYEFDEACL